ncbi:DUF1080 domain-containing protein [Allosphingosinicella sp.]|uniref:3-keto-disaccharide hydrolase n=1 Tax=Allosphingosinicella sp. TaxID=2823234 RepID=UPI003783AC39
MSDRRTFLLGATAAALLPAPAFARAAIRRLFDGRTLAGWTPLGDANWRVEHGLITADRGGISFLVSRERYRDFDLRAEFWVSENANSGIFLRCQDRAAITADNAYEVNIFDRRPDPTYGTGAIVNVAPVALPLPHAGGRWNVMVIRMLGDRFSVVLNGRTTVREARDGRHAEGPVALQYGAGIVRFRRVTLRPI